MAQSPAHWVFLGSKPGVLSEYYDTTAIRRQGNTVFYTGKTEYPNGGGQTDRFLKQREHDLHAPIMAVINRYAVQCGAKRVRLEETDFYGPNMQLLLKTQYKQPPEFQIPPGTTLDSMRLKLCRSPY